MRSRYSLAFRKHWLCLAWLALAGGLVSACNTDRFDKQPGQLLVGVLDDPVFYYPAADGREEGGFEFDLLKSFAESRGQELRIVTARNPAKLRDLLRHRSIDLVAGLPIQSDPTLAFTQPLREAQAIIVQNAETMPVLDPSSLAGRAIEVLSGTVQAAALEQLRRSEPIEMVYPRDTNGIDLLKRVAEFRSELAATDTIHYGMASNFYPELVIVRELTGTIGYSWACRRDDQRLCAEADTYIAQATDSGALVRLQDRYFGHITRIDPFGTMAFMGDVRNVLPQFRSLFEDAQQRYGIDWRLLAALAYQESKWNPLATSYTNVRGIMMLTEETADRLGVTNRLDPAQSILAGARYLSELLRRLPAEVPEPDRQWFALAAYNLGYGHLNGARQIAPSLGRDPNSWYEMKKVLPLMARPEYYARLKSGRARGGEAVILTENVRVYYDILKRLEPQYASTG